MRSTKKGKYDKSVKDRNEKYRWVRKFSSVKKGNYMSHRNHHAHTHHKHKLTEAEWVEHMKSRGFVVEEIGGHHEHHEKHHLKYNVFKIVNEQKELLQTDEHGDVVEN